MSLLQAINVSLEFGDRKILDNTGLVLSAGRRYALVGANGCGKSTLFTILSEERKPDSGTLSKKKGLRLAYLPQSGIVFVGHTLEQELETAFDEGHKAMARIDSINQELGSGEQAHLDKILEELQDLEEMLEFSGFNQRQARIHEVASGLGFIESDFFRSCSEFSGGWQMRIALAKVLLKNPDVLLLDEPTNYLDLPARWWLRDFLKRFAGAVALVSHDRSFLNAVVDNIVELYQGKLRNYPGNYDQYQLKRRLELEQVLAAWSKQQDQIAHLEKFVERFRYKASKASQAQSRLKELERIEIIEIPDGIKTAEFRCSSAPPCSQNMLSLSDLSRSYGSHQVLRGFSLDLQRGDRVAVIGKNGAGKSTLMRLCALVDKPDSGSIAIGNGVRQAYFMQDNEVTIEDLTVIQKVASDFPALSEQTIRTLLGSFLFSGDDIEKPLTVLSGGERSRLALFKVLMQSANLLLLDEPSNHLDMSSKRVLLDALKSFDGAIVFVSHDQDFIEELATRIVEIKPGPDGEASRHTVYDGDWDYFLWKNSLAGPSSKSVEKSEALIHGLLDNHLKPEKLRLKSDSDQKTRREEDKRRKSEIKKLQKREEEILAAIDTLSLDRKVINEEMGLESVYSNGLEVKKRQALLSDLEMKEGTLNNNWEDCVAALEQLILLENNALLP